MAGIEITISGALYDKTARTTQAVLIVGEASLTGLGVGGGPIIPSPPDEKPPRPPLGIWGGPWDPPHPAHPIVRPPDPPTEPPVDPPVDPPSPQWSWVWNPRYGWHPAYVAGDKPHPPQ